jgi:riboflavin synthase
MFTGIIEEIGIIKSLRHGGRSSVMTVSAGIVLEDLKTGDSINVDGVCLTVVTFTGDSFTVDLMPESMQRSAFSRAKTGNRVNLERALRLSDRLGGHIVSGHIDDTGTILSLAKDGNATRIRIGAGSAVLRYIVEKGSVAIDGISLTVTAIDDRTFEVSVIPHTNAVTTLTGKKSGDLVNIECDVIAKYIEKLAGERKSSGKVDLDFLAEKGFI